MNPLIIVGIVLFVLGGLFVTFLPEMIDRGLDPSRKPASSIAKRLLGIAFLAVLIGGGIWGPLNRVWSGVMTAIVALMIIVSWNGERSGGKPEPPE